MLTVQELGGQALAEPTEQEQSVSEGGGPTHDSGPGGSSPQDLAVVVVLVVVVHRLQCIGERSVMVGWLAVQCVVCESE